jgi:uncharacterized repeat protein (TIGR03803 family)
MVQIGNGWANGFVATALASAALLHVSVAGAAEVVVHSFQPDGADGYAPRAGLIDVDGILYGVTNYGGANSVGTVFSINAKTGAEKVIYSFQNNGVDGANPDGGLVAVKGTLYGTTDVGGVKAVGTVFKVSPATGKETVLYSFCNVSGTCEDGFHPLAGLTVFSGTLYGTTTSGGTANGGTVFSVNRTTGKEAVIYSFQRDGVDGNTPYAGVINVVGTLYGATIDGGAGGSGTVFSVDPATGAEKVLHSFDGTDGYQPYASLIDVKGALYGTTVNGGTDDYGTVFKVDSKTGAETVSHSFTGGADGYDPEANLINVKGTLYGTTYRGGPNGGGTVFKINPKNGAEKVLYSFCGQASCADGDGPLAGLIDVNGALYGTTEAGGAYNQGTVFKIKLR